MGCCLLVFRRKYRGPIPITRVYLNAAGENESDSPCIEYNDLLCLHGWEEAIAVSLKNYLLSQTWDELMLTGCRKSIGIDAICSAFKDLAKDSNTKPSFYVDLDGLRHTHKSFKEQLSTNTRSQIGRSRRRYEEYGSLHTEVAANVTEGLSMLNQLIELHQQTWRERGKSGVFCSKLFYAFHTEFIRQLLPQGGIQLLRVTAGDTVIGVLYNFVWQNKVYFYQSGFSYSKDNKLKPGMVTHLCAIEYCLNNGYVEYDFLAGDDRYKQSLSKSQRQLNWIVILRPTPKTFLIRVMRKILSLRHAK